MGRIKQIVTMYRDLNPNDETPPLSDLIEYWRVSGDRLGLTDEQLREVGDE